jgi:hypothetical protein
MYVGEFRLENAFCGQKRKYGTLLKSHLEMFSARFRFMQNGKKKQQSVEHSDWLPTEVLPERLQNVPEVTRDCAAIF